MLLFHVHHSHLSCKPCCEWCTFHQAIFMLSWICLTQCLLNWNTQKKGTSKTLSLSRRKKSFKSTRNLGSLDSSMKCTCHFHYTSRRDSRDTALGRSLPASQFPSSWAAYFQQQVSGYNFPPEDCTLCAERKGPWGGGAYFILNLCNILPPHMNKIIPDTWKKYIDR